MDKFCNYSSDSDHESDMRHSVKSEQSSEQDVAQIRPAEPQSSEVAAKLASPASSRTVSQEEPEAYMEEAQAQVEELPSELRDLGLDVNFCDDFVQEEANQVEKGQEAKMIVEKQEVIAEVQMKEEAIEYKQFLTKHLPIIGKVPMMFYLPEVPESKGIKELIQKSGGLVLEQHECCSIQLKPEGVLDNVGLNSFYRGEIYSSVWIVDSVKKQKLLPKSNYLLTNNTSSQAIKLNIGKRKRYSISEGILMYEIMGAQSGRLHTSEFWKNLEQQHMLPERSAESMKGFFQKQEKTQLETFLVQCLHEKVDFCFSIRKVPSKDFEWRFREQFAIEFQQLESVADHVEANDSDDYIKGYYASESSLQHTNSNKSVSSFSNSSNLSNPAAMILDKENVEKKEEGKAVEQKELTLKPVQRLCGLKRTFNSYKVGGGDLCLNERTRMGTLDNLSHALNRKRFQAYVPREEDLPQYSVEKLEKQMDIEILQITAKRDEEREEDLGEGCVYYRRSMTKRVDPQGVTRRLVTELEEIAQAHSMELEDVLKIFGTVSCDKQRLRDTLSQKSFERWTSLEDVTIRRPRIENEEAFEHLLQAKGKEELQKRRKFLELSPLEL